MRDHFGVAGRRQSPSRPQQLIPELDVVVDLAVLHHGDGAAVDRDRLMTAGDVDDAQARRAQRGGTVGEHAAIVGAAMAQRRHHAREPIRIGPVTGQRDEACDAAHVEEQSADQAVLDEIPDSAAG